MKKEKKELMKKFKNIIEDLLDNYDKYTDSERKQIKEIFDKVADLNKILDKYDEEAKKSRMSDYIRVYSEYFDIINY